VPSTTEESTLIATVENENGKEIIGQEEFVRGLLVGLLANGQVLIEGVPGLG
jgi:MoxR-like ATPase